MIVAEGLYRVYGFVETVVIIFAELTVTMNNTNEYMRCSILLYDDCDV